MIHNGPLRRAESSLDSWADRLTRPVLKQVELLELASTIEGSLDVAYWVAALRSSRICTLSRLRLDQTVFEFERDGGEWSRVRACGVVSAHELERLTRLGCEVQVVEDLRTG